MSKIGFCLDLDDSESASEMVATMAKAFQRAMRETGRRCPTLFVASVSIGGRTVPRMLTTSKERCAAFVRGYAAAGGTAASTRLTGNLQR